MGHKEEKLFTGLADAAERSMRDFNSQDVAKTAWAFATLSHKEKGLFTALAAVSPFSVPAFPEVGLATGGARITKIGCGNGGSKKSLGVQGLQSHFFHYGGHAPPP